ncbi:MAG: hypothetical protein WCK43_05395 [bacterium]
MRKIVLLLFLCSFNVFSASIPGLEEVFHDSPLPRVLQVLPQKCSFENSNHVEIKYDQSRFLSAKVCLTETIDLHFMMSIFALPVDSQLLQYPSELLPTRLNKTFRNQKFSVTVICSLATTNPFCEIQMQELEYGALYHNPRFQNVSLEFALNEKNDFINLKYDLDQELTGDALWLKIQKIEGSSFSRVRFQVQE